jgi:serine/threonine-protein kinase
MPRPGDQITPSIRLVRELGSGGMGSVWVADHGSLQTQVVVKFMHVQLTGDRESVLRFSREAAAGANVKSPHVVQVYDHGIAPDGAPFIVMELLEGSDLAAHCEKNGPMLLVEVDHVISQTCKALARAHERGIVHRDIKPQNIFLTNVGGGEPFVKVLDFGIAKAGGVQNSMSSATKTGALMGTPYYMSPEQTIGAKGVDHRTDLWALGVVAFECLTGQRPFEAETIGGLAVAICHGPMPVPSRINRTLPPEVDRWFATACAREVTQRFNSAKEMADGLHMLVTARLSDQRFSSDPRGLPHAATEMAAPLPLPPTVPTQPNVASMVTEPAPTLGVTTRAPVSGEVEDTPRIPKRGKGASLGIATAVVLLGAVAVGLKMASPSPAQPSAASAQAAEPPTPATLEVHSPPLVPPSAAPVALSPLAVAAPPVAAPTARTAQPKPTARTSTTAPPPLTAQAPASLSSPPTLPKSTPNCNPPFILDSQNHKVPKPECE